MSATTQNKTELISQDTLQFVLLAPPNQTGATRLRGPREDKLLYNSFLRAAQKLRGSVYFEDGAVQSWQLDLYGRFRMPGDRESWQLLLVEGKRNVVGCSRFRLHPNTVTFDSLSFRHAAIAKDRTWGKKVRDALEKELSFARDLSFGYVELGGWALAPEWRGTRAALKILLASYAWTSLMGGCICACTATVRHGSSSILRRVGGSSLVCDGVELPSYVDPAYGCEMEILRFDSRHPNPRFKPMIEEVAAELMQSPVLANARQSFQAGAANAGAVAPSLYV